MKKIDRSEPKTSKITINVWRPVWSKLEKRLEAACLKRDAYIGALIDRELDHLQAEMSIANSESAEQFISKQLRALLQNNSTPLSIALRPEIAKKLETVCSERRIVRDAFFNRLFLFIAYGPNMAGALLFRNSSYEDNRFMPTAWTNAVWSEYKHEGPFYDNVFDPFHAHLDPIWPIRAFFELTEESDPGDYVEWTDPESKKVVKMVQWVPAHILRLPYAFYTTVLTDHALLRKTESTPTRQSARVAKNTDKTDRAYHNLYGLNCYLPNFLIPGHAEQKALEKETEELLADL